MTKFSSLRITHETDIIREKDGDLSLMYNGLFYSAIDKVPPHLLGHITACLTRDYGDMRNWPELARQFVSLRTAYEHRDHRGKPPGDDPDRSSA